MPVLAHQGANDPGGALLQRRLAQRAPEVQAQVAVDQVEQVQAGGAARWLDESADPGGEVQHVELPVHDGVGRGVALGKALRAAHESLLDRARTRLQAGLGGSGVRRREQEVGEMALSCLELPEDADAAFQGREELRVLRDVLGVAEEQEPARPQGEMEERDDPVLQGSVEVDQQVAAGH